MQPVRIEDLKKVIALSDLPDEHLQWLIDRSEYSEYADGDIISKYGDPADKLWISLQGKITFYMYINGRQVYYFTFENDQVTGGTGGLMPYSRMTTIPGYSYALGEVRLLGLNKKYFAELEELNPQFIQRLIGYMTNRAKAFATTQLQYEKVNALGNLAAGIAHEFNNPAAAISEIAGELSIRVNRTYALTQQLLSTGMAPSHLESIQSIFPTTERIPAQADKRSTLERIEREDEMDDWLNINGIDERQIAETFTENGFLVEDLARIRSQLSPDLFTALVPWLENIVGSQKLIRDLADAAQRISTLVHSIKSHVHMDRTNELQPTNIHHDIENTLTLLGFKLREKNIQVSKRYCADMPEVPAYVGELNQVWTNLIDNAIFALEPNGTLCIETTCDEKSASVFIIDNGKGIPKDIISRIFDPFFTTKKIGEGTGIGLDIVSRVVKRHCGEIKVNSEPGRTEFAVCLPVKRQPSS